MSKKNLYLLGIALTWIFGTLLYQKFCCNCCVKPPESDTSSAGLVPKEGVLDPFRIKGLNFDYHCIDNTKFVKNSSVAITPFADSVAIGFEKLKLALTTNPNQKLRITGFATSDEKNTSTYPNLALARANDLKNYFISNGFNSNQFELNGEVRDKWQMVSDTLVGAVHFEILQATPADSSSNDWVSLKDKINKNPLVLYFNTNESNESMSADEQSRLTEIANYIANVPGSTINVVGHADNVGAKDLNVILAQKRADFTKKQLVKKGINSDRIKTSSQGSDAPIADNATEEGKAKNRRTVVIIK